MSGTSMDGIDLAVINFKGDRPEMVCCAEYNWPQNLEKEMHPLCLTGNDEVEIIGDISIKLAQAYASAVNDLLEKKHIPRENIVAIGNHGQTIRHRPERGFSVQIGNNAMLAALTGIDTIGDFRNADMALGGQGAPLVPAFHRNVFYKHDCLRFILNIGGIANISVLDGTSDQTFGFDTGPGNTLLDQNCRNIWDIPYDKDGYYASQGNINNTFIDKALSHPYFSKPFPKSTGRETFTYEWIKSLNKECLLSNYDLQRSLTFLTAKSISDEILKIASNREYEVYVCGGGIHNSLLMKDLETLLKGCVTLGSTSCLGINPDFVEAAAFAWLAKQFIERKPGNLPSVTGASGYAVLGCLYPKPL